MDIIDTFIQVKYTEQKKFNLFGNGIAKLSPQLQVKLCLKAELVLISANPATHPPPPPQPPPPPGKVYFSTFFSESWPSNLTGVYQDPNWKTTSTFWQMEDDLNYLENGRRPQFFGKWKTTSIFLENGIQPQFRTQIGRRPQLFGKWKTTSIFWKMEDDLNSLENGRRPQFCWKMEHDPNSKVNGRWP